MTGMPDSNHYWRCCLVLACGLPQLLHADDLTLTDGARLSGTVRSISGNGVVELSSALAPERIMLKGAAVGKVEFTAAEPPAALPATLVELANGDLLPATIESLDDHSLSVVTPDAGRLTIPRTALKSIQLGVHRSKVIYSGPKGLDEWIFEPETSKNWTFANKTLTSNGPTTARQNLATPQQFIFRFTLKWQANPMFQIYFADPLTPGAKAVDRYYMTYNGAGLEIKRESTTGNRYQTVILLARSPDQFPNNQLDVEIRVDRRTSRLHLLLNGEPEAAGVDPSGAAPVGSGVTLRSNSPAGITQEISGIEILELDNASSRHHAEDRGDPKTDSLISRDEDRWGGRLTGIRKGPDGALFTFKSDFQQAPLEIPETDVSTIFFAQVAQENKPAETANPLALRLRGEGLLRVSSCEFSEAGITAVHPLLGPLKISRAGVMAIERPDLKPPAQPTAKPEPEE